MRLKSTASDLPSSYDVKIHLHNQFVEHMKEDIAVRCSPLHTLDGTHSSWVEGAWKGVNHLWWMVSRHHQGCISGDDHTLDGSQGEGVENESRGHRFKALVGNHNRENLGRYVVGLLDCVGIMNKKGTNAHCLSSLHIAYLCCTLLIFWLLSHTHR